ncbi:MAG: tetratricopeptide repeat protein [Pyrinomonadaceae bacterium]
MLENNRNVLLRRVVYFLIAIILFSSLSAFVKAQGYGDRTGDGGENKNHSVQGRISFPSNQPGTALKVRLESSASATLTTVSNSEGIFYFSGLYPGQYTIIIDAGNDYEPIRESLTVERDIVSSMSRTYNVMIDLREKSGQRQQTGVVNVSLAKVPKLALEQFKKGLEARDKNDDKTAVERFTEAVRIYPQFAEAYDELGTLYLKTGETNKAEDAIRRTLQFNEKNMNAQLNYGIVLLNQRKMYEAEKQLEKVVLADDTAATPHMYLGIALLGLNYPDYAEKEFLKAISLKDDGKLAQAHRYLGGIYWKKGNYTQAAAELEKYLALEPKASDADRVRATVKQLREKTK